MECRDRLHSNSNNNNNNNVWHKVLVYDEAPSMPANVCCDHHHPLGANAPLPPPDSPRMRSSTLHHYALDASNVCLVDEHPTCSVPAL